MSEVLSSAQMRAIERAAMDSGAATGLDLMERAGRGVVDAMFAQWPDLAAVPHRALVLCGPGNNGGDGFVVARLLKGWGWDVELFLHGDADRLPPDARANCQRWETQGEVKPLTAGAVAAADMLTSGPAPLVIDAMFGTGLARAVSVDLCQALEMAMASASRVVSIDIPSGICADSGRLLMAHVPDVTDVPDKVLTVSFHRAKLGHYLAEGPARCGALRVASIGLPMDAALGTRLVGEGIASVLGKGRYGHKYSHGHALILSGGVGKGGAARLAARGALRVGAGLVTIVCPPAALQENAARLDAIMLRALRGESEAAALTAMLEDARITSLCIGPGLGVRRARALVEAGLRAGHAPNMVLDADALTGFADDPAGLLAMLHDGCVLTPHGGEFARLFPDIAAKLAGPATAGPAYSRVDATRDAAARAGCVLLLKGPDTVIADAQGNCAIHGAHFERAAPWLATAGSGDVLAGFITGLLARGFAPMQAAEAATWLHVECARSFGPGLIAEDLPEELPKVLRALDV